MNRARPAAGDAAMALKIARNSPRSTAVQNVKEDDALLGLSRKSAVIYFALAVAQDRRKVNVWHAAISTTMAFANKNARKSNAATPSPTRTWENNPEGKYAFGAICVQTCAGHLLKDNGACVRICPPKKKALNGECVTPCEGVDIVHAGNIESFKDCTVINGSVTIIDHSFAGFQQIYPHFTFFRSTISQNASRPVGNILHS